MKLCADGGPSERTERRHVLMREHAHHAALGERFLCIDRRDPSGRDGRGDQHGVEETRRAVVGRIAGAAGHLGRTVEAGQRLSDGHEGILAAVSITRSAAFLASGIL